MSQHEALIWWIGIGSAVMFAATLLAVPWVVAQLPADYFVNEERKPFLVRSHPAVRGLLVVLKNVLAIVLLLAGVAMLALPGQGVLTILLALSLLDFPGKYKLQQKLVSRPKVYHSLNWLRQRLNEPPLLKPEDDDEEDDDDSG